MDNLNLDESAIEAEAFRLASSDIDRLDRMLTVAEIRRDKALHCIADYRDSLAQRLQQSSQKILEAADVLHIEHKSTTKNDQATERQIAANRRNARKSTGPRSGPGKKRAGQNALRHGLSVRIAGAEFERRLEVLALQIAGDTNDRMTLDYARMAAEAELEIARVRKVKSSLIERIVAFGGFEPPKHFSLRWPRSAGSSPWMITKRAAVSAGWGPFSP